MLNIPPLVTRRELGGNRFFAHIEEDLGTASGPYTYSFIESKWDAVIVVPVLPDGCLLVERIYRHPYRAFLHEFPAGGIEPGEDPLKAGARELEEETGWKAGRCRKLAEYSPIPGLVRMQLHVLVADQLEWTGFHAHEAMELIEVEQCTREQAWIYARAPQASAFLLQGLLLYEQDLLQAPAVEG